MKTILAICVLLTLTGCCGCMPPHKKTTMDARSGLACSSAKVSGMTCEACTMTITKNLKTIPQIKDVTVDVNTGTVKIYSDPSAALSRKTVSRIVEKSGYTLQSISTNCQ